MSNESAEDAQSTRGAHIVSESKHVVDRAATQAHQLTPSCS